ncbi:hypothetical protein [Salinimicrobium soli]|uniref:hypothetical protein n=1 Tax=Salinimicrobium soli TaxID=1254399 RepID=UPI003AAF7D86
MANDDYITTAEKLLNDFAERTEIESSGSQNLHRYLWTDAFAVKAFFGMYHLTSQKRYFELALRLIDLVHENLGKYRPQDEREGWISGLNHEQGLLHPTVAGLRIGKKFPERQKHESYNSSLEWERDGQYFHYLSRWVMALLQADKETGDEKYAYWALELMLAAEKFIYETGTGYAMYWKMNTELTRPLVASMGAHDPLEGLLCTKSIQARLPGKASDLDALAKKFKSMCSGRTWSNPDALGIGGLLLNSLKAKDLASHGFTLPDGSKPSDLVKEVIESLTSFSRTFSNDESAEYRLAFRECGLSLGLQTVLNSDEISEGFNSEIEELEKYRPMALEIEEFWLQEEHQQSSTWKEHENINMISLACSLIAHQAPEVFSGN